MSCARIRKTHVSDRAKRYRANQPGCVPSGSRECALCGSRRFLTIDHRRFLTIDHRDGDESNGAKSNLRWLCKSCNTREGAKMAKKGKGRRTVQFNPASDFEAGAEAASMYARINVRPDRASFLRAFNQWKRAHGKNASLANFTAGFRSAAPEHWSRNPGAKTLGEYLNAVLMHTRGAHDEGGRTIHETSKSKRAEYASEIWARRKSHGNPLRKWTPAILNGARVRIRAVGKGLQVDLGKLAKGA